MYDVYAFATPNSVEVPIALEELGLKYALHPVNVKKGEQKHADFIALNPNGKVPVLRDSERDFTLSESAAILVYLAERHGALLAQDPLTRARTSSSCSRMPPASARLSGKRVISCASHPLKRPDMRWTALHRRRGGSSAFSTQC